jgi:hypothetical protein
VQQLTSENYRQGFLVDEELMAGVTEHPEQPGLYVAFVLHHTTGEYLGYQPFHELTEALTTINKIPRDWAFEKVGGCGGCGGEGKCEGGKCGTKSCPGTCGQ